MNERFDKGANGWRRQGIKALYVLLLILIGAFLYELGSEPWVLVQNNWPVLVALMGTTGLGLIVQARSFRAVTPQGAPYLHSWRITHIWALAAISSVVAPLFAGITTRTVLLCRAGMSLSDCFISSGRQFWLGIEIACVMGAISVPLTALPYSSWIGFGLALAWLVMVLLRRVGAREERLQKLAPEKLYLIVQKVGTKFRVGAYPWFVLQVLMMGATFYVGFNGMGASVSGADVIALASLTVLLSVVVFVPNGLGITDAVWILIATKAGLSLEESVAIALVLRIAHLLAAIVLWLSTLLNAKNK